MTGLQLIAAERERQIDAEHYDARHDDEHNGHELALAAACYAAPEAIYVSESALPHYATFTDAWPWDPKDDKRIRDGLEAVLDADDLRADTRIRQLAKAGALIAAEIDRLQRRQKGGSR